MANRDPQLDPERLEPHSAEAEEATLGACLVFPSLFHEIAALLTPEDFFLLKCSYLWQAMKTIHDRGDSIDDLTVLDELANKGLLEEVGGPAYLTRLMNATPDMPNAETYARIVLRGSIRRRLLSAASDIAQLAQDQKKDIHEVLDAASAKVLEVSQSARGPSSGHTAAQMAETFIEDVDDAYTNRGKILGVQTGFYKMDARISGGIPRDALVTLAARTSHGKTTLLLNLVLNMLVNLMRLNSIKPSGKKILMFSLETKADRIFRKLMAMATSVQTQKFATGFLSEEELGTVTAMAGKASQWPLIVHDDLFRVEAIIAESRKHRNLEAIVVDYCQLVEMEGARRGSKEDVARISYVSRMLKHLALQLNTPVIQAAQINRDAEDSADKRPELRHLKGSGSIEEDSDIVWGLYRPGLYKSEVSQSDAEWWMLKQRDGEMRFLIDLVFNGTTGVFKEK